MGGVCTTYRGEVHIGFWWGNLRKGDHLEYPDIDGRIMLQWNLRLLNGGHRLG